MKARLRQACGFLSIPTSLAGSIIGGTEMQVIKVACANHYVASSVGYHYVGVFLYSSRVLKNGKVTFGPGKLIAGPFRSQTKAEKIGKQKSEEMKVEFVSGYGSMYGKNCTVSNKAMIR